MAAEAAVFQWRGEAIIGATTTQRRLSQQELVQVQQAWAVRVPDFDMLLDSYKAHYRKLARNKKTSLKHWKVPASVASTWGGDLLERMLKIKLMSRSCQVHNSLISWVVLLVTPHTILSPTVLLDTIHSINRKNAWLVGRKGNPGPAALHNSCATGQGDHG